MRTKKSQVSDDADALPLLVKNSPLRILHAALSAPGKIAEADGPRAYVRGMISWSGPVVAAAVVQNSFPNKRFG
jgi:hypothetical protein